MASRKNLGTLPGDKMAVIEEFEAGSGVYVDQGLIRSRIVGESQIDLSKHTISVKPRLRNLNEIRKGDTVIGYVESAQAGIVSVKIYYVNEKPNSADFSGIIFLRGNAQRDRRGPSMPCKIGDAVRAQVVSMTNAVISLSVEPESCGVLRTACCICGSPVIIVRFRVKCTECGFIDDRKLSSDFEKPFPP